MPKINLLDRRRFLLLGLASLAGMSSVGADCQFKKRQILGFNDATRDFTVSGTASLKQRAAAKGLIYGAAIRADHLADDPKLAASVAQECAMLIPEWALKWSAPSRSLRPTPDTFDFSAADEMLKFAKTNKMQMRGHTLVWHESLPDWFGKTVNSQNARAFLEKHIKTVVGRYAGQMHSWDVVNEAIEEGYLLTRGESDGLRKTPWLKLLGPNYIDLAFRTAAAADPKALLVYNDYGLEYDTHEDETKRNAVLLLLQSLKSNGTPIHALGIQAHLDAGETRFNPKKLRDFLRNVASLGLKIMITELDVTDKKLPRDIEKRDRIIASAYEDYLSVVLAEPAVIAVLNWGLSDRYSWLSEFQKRADKAPVRPLLFDDKMNRKLAWNAMARAFDKAVKR